MGIYGGGWDMHNTGGNLNPHPDHSIRPKFGLQRKLNIILCLSKDLQPRKHKGHHGLWSHDEAPYQPNKLVREVVPILNRVIIFDTIQLSWHGISRQLQVPKGIYRKSLAVYYLTEPKQADFHQREVYGPRETQKNIRSYLNQLNYKKTVNFMRKPIR
jgi:hypothetical protein